MIALLHSVYLLTLAYVLAFHPNLVYTNVFVVSLGQSLSSRTGAGSEGMLSVLLTLLAFEDLVKLASPLSLEAMMETIPVRILILAVFAILCYFVKLEVLACGPVFAFLFIECLWNAFIFVSYRNKLNEKNKSIVREQRGYAS